MGIGVSIRAAPFFVRVLLLVFGWAAFAIVVASTTLNVVNGYVLLGACLALAIMAALWTYEIVQGVLPKSDKNCNACDKPMRFSMLMCTKCGQTVKLNVESISVIDAQIEV